MKKDKALITTLVITGLVLVFVIIIIVVASKKKNLKVDDPTGEQPKDTSVTPQVIDQQPSGNEAPDFKKLAIGLYNAFNFPGTDEETVYKIFGNLKSEQDVADLIQAYGKKTLYGVTPFDTLWNGSLIEAVKSEMDEDEIAKLNQVLNQKGIAYKFYA